MTKYMSAILIQYIHLIISETHFDSPIDNTSSLRGMNVHLLILKESIFVMYATNAGKIDWFDHVMFN